MILLIDNFDSFTHNLQDYLEQQGVEVLTVRYNVLAEYDEYLERADAIVISPGPGRPNDYPLLFDAIERYEGRKPILGVCLGHQTIGSFYGAKLQKANRPMHGKVSIINHESTGIYRDISTPTAVTRYHSLLLTDLPEKLRPTAFTGSGELMSFEHSEKPVWGVQYHPEAILTTSGLKIIENFVSFVREHSEKNVKGQIEVVRDL